MPVKKRRRQKKQSASKSFKVKLAVMAVVMVGVAVSFLNTTGMVTGDAHKIAFITAQQELHGSEKSIFELLSEKYFVEQIPLDKIGDMSGYGLVVISRQAGDAVSVSSECKDALSGKSALFFSSDFAITCKLSTGGSVAPYMPWKIISVMSYPTEKYSGIITPYMTSESIPAVVASDGGIILVKRNVNDAYFLIYNSKTAFFSVPQNSFAFTKDGKNIFLGAVEWLL